MKEIDRKIRKQTLNASNYRASEIKNSFLILEHTHEAARTLLRAFDIVRKRRKGGRKGGTTDQEQDILRAMLVLAAAGVDSMTKQLIRDSLRLLLPKQPAARLELRKFVHRKLRIDGAETNPEEFREFLTNLIVAETVQAQAIGEYIGYLTSSSLQSAEELIRAARALGVGQDEIKLDAERLKRIFTARNQIIHELDVRFGAPKRNRRVRKRSEMIDDSNYLLDLGEKVLLAVGARLQSK
ncbi:MAG: hypothetical protein PHH26_03995 [Candidatus Thermoplasmatota archaeon]|nr:hypothetical protein [Candidatus Thermoplasmatota archaeon]